jgi:hypothetical protein
MTGSRVRACVNTPILDTLRLTFMHRMRVPSPGAGRPRRNNAVRAPAG